MKNVAIIGDSHTGIALAKKLMKHENFKCVLVGKGECPAGDVNKFLDCDIFFAVSDDDAENIRTILLIRKNNARPIYTVLIQMNLASKIEKMVPNVKFVNQAELAAKKFVLAMYEDDESPHVSPESPRGIKFSFKMDPLIRKATMFIGGLLLGSTIFFMFNDGMRWIDAVYFTVTMMTTVGFGDYSLRDHGDGSKMFGTVVMILSVLSVSLIFALINDTLIRKRKEFTHGITKYKGKGHVIVVGGGSVGYRVLTELIAIGEHPVLIDKNIDGRFVPNILAMKVPFLIGDATNEELLVAANIAEAKGVIAVTQNDLVNLEVGLDSKTLHPDKRVVLRIYDQKLSSSLKDNKIINHSYSMSSIAADHLISAMDKE